MCTFRPHAYAAHVAASLLWGSTLLVAADAGEPRAIDFVRDVQPILRENCRRCHGAKTKSGGVQLNRRAAVYGVGDSGELVVAKHRPDESLLIRRVSSDAYGDQMPPDSRPLSSQQIGVLRQWIQEGAPWPDEVAEPRHWAYLPIVRPEVPAPVHAAQNATPIDRFIQRRLAAEGMELARGADRYRLLRRVSLALIGLPPTPQDIERFINDQSPDAYERVVDRLLASPRYGERWAVPWLDLARYADSNGFQADQIRENWAYRDWVIDAFNRDMPLDEFVIDQLAGDLRPDATLPQRVATGFHRMTTCNVEAGVDPEANRINQVVDRVNTTATVFLGATLECAQCHDHKYDPFTQRDYYRLFAYFNNTPLEVELTKGVTWDFYGPVMQLPADDSAGQRRRRLKQKLQKLKAREEALLSGDRPGGDDADANQRQLKRLEQRIQDLASQVDELKPPTTLVMEELPQSRVTHIFERGDYSQPGEPVVPGTPAALPGLAAVPATGDRLELARWLTSPENPLLARVTVNRWWAELFGQGIVATLEDFGTQADAPSHPELLDWLAAELIESGWSQKHVHRLMATSAVFRQASRATPEQLERDPQNRLLARGPRFRLRAETIRDRALAVSGLLSPKMHGPPVMPYQPDGIWRSVGRNQPTWEGAQDEDRFRRGVYVVWKRAAPYPSFVNFDAPDRSSCTVRRSRSNTPLQALTLLNDPAYVEAALALADRILCEKPAAGDEARLDYAVRLALARPPAMHEVTLLKELLAKQRRMLTAAPEMVQQRTRPASGVVPIESQDQTELAAWFAVANTLLNLDEFVNH